MVIMTERKRDDPMKTLPIVPKASTDSGEVSNVSDLPLFYMNDYSKVGLQVSPYEEALSVLGNITMWYPIICPGQI
jgi:hypothetical protein